MSHTRGVSKLFGEQVGEVKKKKVAFPHVKKNPTLQSQHVNHNSKPYKQGIKEEIEIGKENYLNSFKQ